MKTKHNIFSATLPLFERSMAVTQEAPNIILIMADDLDWGFIAWPSQVQGNKRSSKIAITSDYLATFTELLSLPTPPYQLDGESLYPCLAEHATRKKAVSIRLPATRSGYGTTVQTSLSEREIRTV